MGLPTASEPELRMGSESQNPALQETWSCTLTAGWEHESSTRSLPVTGNSQDGLSVSEWPTAGKSFLILS